MAEAKVHNLVFSSSATVYGQPERLPITESSALSATNPYGQTKLFGEQILRDLEASTPGWCVAYLRYFNPVGAHHSGRIGEDPRGGAEQFDALRRAGGRGASVNSFKSLAAITTPMTAPACGTTSM